LPRSEQLGAHDSVGQYDSILYPKIFAN
jgi:hypothetical protein